MVKTPRGCLRAAARQSAEMARARLWPRMESMWDQAESRKARSSGVKDTAEGACDEITVIGRRAGDALDFRDSEPDRVVDDGGCGNPPREVQVVIAGDGKTLLLQQVGDNSAAAEGVQGRRAANLLEYLRQLRQESVLRAHPAHTRKDHRALSRVQS